MNLWTILKGLLLQDETRKKEISIEPAGTDNTRTTVTSSQTSNQTLTLPDATDTLVGEAHTQTITNKNMKSNTNLLTGAKADNLERETGNQQVLTVPDTTAPDTLVSEAHTQTITNKTVGDDLLIQGTTESANKDTGALVVEGGAGIEKNLNVGGSATITGDLTVNGTTTTVNTTNLDVTDANITVNNGGTQAAADLADAGLTVEMSDATNAVIGYDSSLASKFKIGEIGAEKEVVDVSSTQTLTNKTIDGDDNTIQDVGITSLKTELADASKFIERDGSGAVISGKAVPTGDVTGTSDSQTLTNKTIDGTSATGTNNITADASDITYDPSGSSLVSTTDQAALDEVAGRLDSVETTAGDAANKSLSNLTSPTAINQDFRVAKTGQFLLLHETSGDAIRIQTSTSSAAFNAGDVQLIGGAATNSGKTGGDVFISAGGSAIAGALGGSVDINTTSGQDSGNISLTSGNASNGNSGNITLTTGTASGTKGNIILADGSEGTIGHIWTSTGVNGEGSWAAAPATGANTSLSNLTTTSINQHLLPDSAISKNLGSSSLPYNNTYNRTINFNSNAGVGEGAITTLTSPLPSGNTPDVVYYGLAGKHIGMYTLTNGTADANPTGNILIETGNKGAGTGNSGNIVINTGTSAGGTRGSINLTDGSEGNIGDVWTSTGVNGEGNWAAPSGGGSGTVGKLVEGGDVTWIQNSGPNVTVTSYSGGTITNAFNANDEFGQGFTITADDTITHAGFDLELVGAGTGSYTIELREWDGIPANAESGTLVATTAAVAFSTYSGRETRQIPFLTSASVTAAQGQYVLICRADAFVTLNAVNQYFENVDGLYGTLTDVAVFQPGGTGGWLSGFGIYDFNFTLNNNPIAEDLTFGSDAFVQIAGYPDASNKIAAQTISIPAGEVAYVTPNLTATPTTLTVNVDTPDNATAGDYIIASHESDGSAIVGDSIRYDNGETKRLYKQIDTFLGGINHIENSDFETNIDGWVLYNDGASDTPVDGTGGTATVATISHYTGGQVQRGTGSLELFKGTGDAQGEGVSTPFTIDVADKNKKINISFDYGASNVTNMSTGTVTVYVYDVTNATLLGKVVNDQDGGIVPIANGGRFVGSFYATSGTDYRLIYHITDTQTLQWRLYLDNVKISPEEFAPGAIVTSPVSEAPVWTTSSGTLPPASSTTMSWWREGEFMMIRFFRHISGVGTGGGLHLLEIPGGHLPDTAFYTGAGGSGSQGQTGGGSWYDGGTNRSLTSYFIDTQRIAILGNEGGLSAANFQLASGDRISGLLKIKIIGWKASNLVSTTENLFSNTFFATKGAQTPTGTLNGSFNTTVFGPASVSKDNFNTYNSSTGQLTIPQTGYYFTSFSHEINGSYSSGNRHFGRIYNVTKAETVCSAGDRAWTISTTKGHSSANLFYAEKGDILECQAGTDATTPVYANSLGGSAWSVMSMKDFSTFGVHGETELVESTAALASYGITAAQYGDLTSITLTPGEWDIDAQIMYNSNGATTTGVVINGITTYSGNDGTDMVYGDTAMFSGMQNTSGKAVSFSVARKGVTVTATDVYYLKAYASSSTTNLEVAYKISARKIK